MAGSVLSVEFDLSSVTQVRHLVTRSARDAGLEGIALEDFVLAVHEAVTNAVRYGLPPRGIGLLREADTLICEVRDSGPGIPPEVFDRDEPTALVGYGGRGMWLMGRLVDLDVRTGPTGTIVRLSAPLP